MVSPKVTQYEEPNLRKGCHSALFEIPREIRDKIYREAINYDGPVRIWEALLEWEHDIGELKTCRQLSLCLKIDRNPNNVILKPAEPNRVKLLGKLATPTVLLLNRRITKEVLELPEHRERTLNIGLTAFDPRNDDWRPKMIADITDLIGVDTFKGIVDFEIRLHIPDIMSPFTAALQTLNPLRSWNPSLARTWLPWLDHLWKYCSEHWNNERRIPATPSGALRSFRFHITSDEDVSSLNAMFRESYTLDEHEPGRGIKLGLTDNLYADYVKFLGPVS